MSEPISCVEGSSAQVLEEDRRDHGRYSLGQEYEIRLIARPSFQAFAGLLVEFSQEGLGLLLDRDLPPGTVVAIQLRSRNVGRSCILSATVRHTQHEGDRWRTGCSLSRCLSAQEINDLLLHVPEDRDE